MWFCSWRDAGQQCIPCVVIKCVFMCCDVQRWTVCLVTGQPRREWDHHLHFSELLFFHFKIIIIVIPTTTATVRWGLLLLPRVAPIPVFRRTFCLSSSCNWHYRYMRRAWKCYTFTKAAWNCQGLHCYRITINALPTCYICWETSDFNLDSCGCFHWLQLRFMRLFWVQRVGRLRCFLLFLFNIIYFQFGLIVLSMAAFSYSWVWPQMPDPSAFSSQVLGAR